MIDYSSYFNPFSNKLQAYDNFKKMDSESQWKVGVLTFIVGLFLIYPAIPVFRYLVGRFKKEEDSQDPSRKKTTEIARKSEVVPQKAPSFQKQGEPPRIKALPHPPSPIVPSLREQNLHITNSAKEQVEQPQSEALHQPIVSPVTVREEAPSPREQSPLIENSAKQEIEPRQSEAHPQSGGAESLKEKDAPSFPIADSAESQEESSKINLDDDEFEQAEGDDWGELGDADKLQALDEITKSDEIAFQQKKEEAQRAARAARGGKREETVKCREGLAKMLSEKNKELIDTRDTGDCFYHAFALGLSRHLKRDVTVKELRQQISNYVNEIHKKNPNTNWIKTTYDDKYKTETYEDYRTNVEHEIGDKAKGIQIWGVEQRDGIILCELYNVKLHVYEALVLKEEGEPDQYCIDENPTVFPKKDSPTKPLKEGYKIIEMALYPGHFLGVKDIT